MALPLHGGRSAFEPNIPLLDPGAEEPYRLRGVSLDDIPFLIRVYEHGAVRERVACVRYAGQWPFEISSTLDAQFHCSLSWVIPAATCRTVVYFAHHTNP